MKGRKKNTLGCQEHTSSPRQQRNSPRATPQSLSIIWTKRDSRGEQEIRMWEHSGGLREPVIASREGRVAWESEQEALVSPH